MEMMSPVAHFDGWFGDLLLILTAIALCGPIWYFTSGMKHKPLMEGESITVSWLDRISMGFVLVSAVVVLGAPLVSLVLNPSWLTVPLLLVVTIGVRKVRYLPGINDAPAVATRMIVGILLLVLVDIVVGLPRQFWASAAFAVLGAAPTIFSVRVTVMDSRTGTSHQPKETHEQAAIVVRLLLRLPVVFTGLSRAHSLTHGVWWWWINHSLTIVCLGVAIGALGVLALALTLAAFQITIPLPRRKER